MYMASYYKNKNNQNNQSNEQNEEVYNAHERINSRYIHYNNINTENSNPNDESNNQNYGKNSAKNRIKNARKRTAQSAIDEYYKKSFKGSWTLEDKLCCHPFEDWNEDEKTTNLSLKVKFWRRGLKDNNICIDNERELFLKSVQRFVPWVRRIAVFTQKMVVMKNSVRKYEKK
eukprot:443274_1